MPKKNKKEQEVYKCLTHIFEHRYKRSHVSQMKRDEPNEERFTTIQSIEDFLYMNTPFVETSLADKNTPDKLKISRGIIKKAVHRLIKENKITKESGAFELVPHMEKSRDYHPILDIADKIDISIGVPDEMLVLSVAPEYVGGITKYLTALFHRGDILFIPIVDKIICISVYPKRMLFVGLEDNSKISTKKDTQDSSSDNTQESTDNIETDTESKGDEDSEHIDLYSRIKLAVLQFKFDHPDFPHGEMYEKEYHLSHNNKYMNSLIPKVEKTLEGQEYYSSHDIGKITGAMIDSEHEWAKSTIDDSNFQTQFIYKPEE